MKIRTQCLLLIAVLPLMFGACGAATDADTAPDSLAPASAPVISSDTPEKSQSLNPADPSTEKCDGRCCRFKCGNGVTYVSPEPKCGDCAAYADGYCDTRGGRVKSWWGNCG